MSIVCAAEEINLNSNSIAFLASRIISMVWGASVDNLCLTSVSFTSLICEMSNIQLPYRYYDIQSDQPFQKI